MGDDHSRVWQLTRDGDGLKLTHDVHEPDGSPAEVTGYGGGTSGAGSATLQTFRAGTETTIRIPSAAGSAWSLEILPRERLTYRFLDGSGTTVFRVDFDLTQRVPRPPPPWGLTRQRRPQS